MVFVFAVKKNCGVSAAAERSFTLRKFRKNFSLPKAIFRGLPVSRSKVRFFLSADAIVRNIIYLCGAIEKNNLIHHEAKHFF
jgi:hypothetical protein